MGDHDLVLAAVGLLVLYDPLPGESIEEFVGRIAHGVGVVRGEERVIEV